MLRVRIVGGALAGRRLLAPTGDSTRPTSDRVREAVFNRLVHAEFEVDPLSGPVLDLYAGAGGLGIEALSRGAPRCDFVDDDGKACTIIQRNLDALKLGDRGKVHRVRAETFSRRATPGYTLLFADPPYADAGAPLDRALASVVPLLVPGALLVLEHTRDPAPRALAGEVPELELIDQREYGQTIVSFVTARRRGTGSDP